MKTIVISILISFCCMMTAVAQICNNGNAIVLATQADVDAFASDYPSCDSVMVRLEIGGYGSASDITDLSPLLLLTWVNWLWVIDNHQLTNLQGLENLDVDGVGKLAIQQNDVLTDITALSGFGPSVGDMSVVLNPLLTNLDGLDNVEWAGTAVTIRTNVSLVDISALSNFTRSDRIFEISNCDLLTDISPLSNFVDFGEGIPPNYPPKAIFLLYGNDLLEDCSPLCEVLINDLDRLRSINSLTEDISDNLKECNSLTTINEHGVCCPDTLQVLTSASFDTYYRAGNTIHSSATLDNATSYDIYAGSTICFENGFEAPLGTFLYAYISGCP